MSQDASQKKLRDGEEPWFLDMNNNRMCLALRSELPREIEWALSRLVNLSEDHTDRFVLKGVMGLTDAILVWPQRYLAEYYKPDSSLTVPHFTPDLHTFQTRKYAAEAMLVFRNSVRHEKNAIHLAETPKFITILNSCLQLPEDDANAELIGYALDIIEYVVLHFPAGEARTSAAHSLPIHSIERLASTSNDRRLIATCYFVLYLLASNVMHPSDPSTPYFVISPSSPAIRRAMRLMALVGDPPLLRHTLEYFSVFLSNPSSAKAFLLDSELAQTIKLLVTVLHHQSQKELKSVTIVPNAPSMAPAGTIEPYIPSEEELARLLPMPEPDRCFEWMRTMFEMWPGAAETQLSFWTLYRDTFTGRGYQPLEATEVIRNITQQFPQTSAVMIGDKYYIQNLRRRLAPPSTRFRCQWDSCTHPPPDSPNSLYAHICDVHLASAQDNSMRCGWAGCPVPPTPIEHLQRHITTHIPPPSPPPKHPHQPAEGITLPFTTYPHPSATPTLRDPPPPPTRTTSYLAAPAGTEPSGTALLAIYSLRLLYWAAFPKNAAAMLKHDENRFGFPSLPDLAALSASNSQGNLNLAAREEEHGDEELKEGERRGRLCFRDVRMSLSDVMLGDEAIMGWVADILVKTEDVLDNGDLAEIQEETKEDEEDTEKKMDVDPVPVSSTPTAEVVEEAIQA